MSLQRYLDNSWLRAHVSSRREIAELLAIADRDAAQCRTPGLGPEWRFGIAYNAALQLATAALAAAGYEAERQNRHQRTVECLAFTVGLDRREVDFLDLCRRKRHANVYDRIGAVSHLEADELIAFTERLHERVVAWLQTNHPGLAPPR
jgi:hypothetical protein